MTPDADLAGDSDVTTPNYLTIDAQGNVGANFTGIVHAQGLNLDTAPSIAVPSVDTIRWLSGLPAILTANGMTAMLAAWLAPSNNPNPTASLSHYLVSAPNGGNTAALELDAENNGLFSQAYATANGQSFIVIRGDGASQGPQLLTPAQFPPANPFDGQEVAVLANDAGGIVWNLRFRAGPGKWEYIGGPPLFAEVVADQTTSSLAYAAIATAGPSLTIPLAGDYDVEIGSNSYETGAAGDIFHSYDIGATGAVDADCIQFNALNATASGARSRRQAGLAATAALVSKYRVSNAAIVGHWRNRWMKVTPVRF